MHIGITGYTWKEYKFYSNLRIALATKYFRIKLKASLLAGDFVFWGHSINCTCLCFSKLWYLFVLNNFEWILSIRVRYHSIPFLGFKANIAYYVNLVFGFWLLMAVGTRFLSWQLYRVGLPADYHRIFALYFNICTNLSLKFLSNLFIWNI